MQKFNGICTGCGITVEFGKVCYCEECQRKRELLILRFAENRLVMELEEKFERKGWQMLKQWCCTCKWYDRKECYCTNKYVTDTYGGFCGKTLEIGWEYLYWQYYETESELCYRLEGKGF